MTDNTRRQRAREMTPDEREAAVKALAFECYYGQHEPPSTERIEHFIRQGMALVGRDVECHCGLSPEQEEQWTLDCPIREHRQKAVKQWQHVALEQQDVILAMIAREKERGTAKKLT